MRKFTLYNYNNFIPFKKKIKKKLFKYSQV